MVTVGLWGSLRPFADGAHFVEVEAKDLRGVVKALGEKFPGMKPVLDGGVSLSIDGRIYTDRWFQKVGPESEVFILPRLVGG
jgi:sulfur-carrier protein